jgi:hypothetical protein
MLCTTTVILSRFAFRIRNEVQAPSFGVLRYALRNIIIHGVGTYITMPLRGLRNRIII